ncbi:MAG: hypothetical protein KDF65_01295, partial [Anaerolineae bacterium]|nr:hypothetical protein [Anaerolineae bacterium]
YMSGCTLIENEISPGLNEAENQSYGAAIFTSPDTSRNLPVLGAFGNCKISNNIGLPIFDDDRSNGPINDVHYNGNQIYSTTFGGGVYRNAIVAGTKTVAELNTLTVTRNTGQNTVKAQSANSEPTNRPSIGSLLVFPSISFDPSSQHQLGYAWSGGGATLDGAPLTNNTGATQVTGPGTYVLQVDSNQISTTVIEFVVTDRLYLPAVLR